MNPKQMILIEVIIMVVSIALIILSVTGDLDLMLFKIYSTGSLNDVNEELEKEKNTLDLIKTKHQSSLKNLETAKTNYSEEKLRYESIQESTISILNDATKGEEYNIEYMWISLGNYAIQNNLQISLDESAETSSVNKETTKTDTLKSSEDDKETTNEVDLKTLRIQVKGPYLNVSEFIYDVESDADLRFNLDNIRMEYDEENNIKAIFEVTGLELKN